MKNGRTIRGLAFVALGAWVAGPVRAETDDLETSVARMARIGSASSPSFSPDGTQLAFVSNLGGVPQVWVVPSAGGYPELVTPFEDPVGGVEWSPDGDWLAFT